MKNILVKKKSGLRHSKILFYAFASVLFLVSCQDKKVADEHEEEEGTKTEVELTLEQYKTVGITTSIVKNRNLNMIIKANGYTAVPPQNMANISTLIGGVVKDIYVLEGTFVSKGKVLATLQNLDIVEMQEEYKSAIASIEYLQLEYNRQKTLSDENVNPRKIFQEVKSKLTVEKAKAHAAKSKLEALHVSPTGASSLIPIIAPISGYVGEIKITKGAYAETGFSLFEVVDNSQMHLDLNVYEKDLETISVGQEVDFILTNQSNRAIKGKIFGINKSFSNESKTVAVHAKINQSDTKDLISGMYVSANININNATVPALPKEAIVKDGDKYYVFVKEKKHVNKHPKAVKKEMDFEKPKHNEENQVHFKTIEVQPGTTDMGFTEVKFMTNLPSDAQIVTKGAFYLLSAMKGGGAHEH